MSDLHKETVKSQRLGSIRDYHTFDLITEENSKKVTSRINETEKNQILNEIR